MLSGVAPDGAVTEKSLFQSLNLMFRLSAMPLRPLAWLESDGGRSIANCRLSSVGRWVELSNESDPWAVLIACEIWFIWALSLAVIPLLPNLAMSAKTASTSRSAEMVSWPFDVDRLRFFSHLLGSRPSALSASRPPLVVEFDWPADVSPFSGSDFHPGPISAGSCSRASCRPA